MTAILLGELTKPQLKNFLRLLLCALGAWTLLVPILALQWWLNNLQMPDPPSYGRFVGIVFATYVSFAILTPALFLMVRRWPIAKPHLVSRTLLYLAGAGAFILVAPAVRLILLPPWDTYAGRFVPRNLETYTNLMTSRFADCLIAYLMLLAAAHAFELYDRARQQQIEQSELRKVLAESELEILKTQLHPHFLFNTLQGISSLIQENPSLARQMIVALAGLLRAALKHSSGDVVALETEMEFLTAYLNLEKMRLGERLQVRLGISQDARQCLVPQLILQPLVENAIVHGIAKGRNGGWIEISSELNEQQLRLRVTNSLSSPASDSGTGVGISNVRSRLKHLYEDDARLTFRRTDSTAEALLVLPALRGKPVCTPS